MGFWKTPCHFAHPWTSPDPESSMMEAMHITPASCYPLRSGLSGYFFKFLCQGPFSLPSCPPRQLCNIGSKTTLHQFFFLFGPLATLSFAVQTTDSPAMNQVTAPLPCVPRCPISTCAQHFQVSEPACHLCTLDGDASQNHSETEVMG